MLRNGSVWSAGLGSYCCRLSFSLDIKMSKGMRESESFWFPRGISLVSGFEFL